MEGQGQGQSLVDVLEDFSLLFEEGDVAEALDLGQAQGQAACQNKNSDLKENCTERVDQPIFNPIEPDEIEMNDEGEGQNDELMTLDELTGQLRKMTEEEMKEREKTVEIEATARISDDVIEEWMKSPPPSPPPGVIPALPAPKVTVQQNLKKNTPIVITQSMRGRPPNRNQKPQPEPKTTKGDAPAPRPIPCIKCPMTFPSHPHLYKHVNLTHTFPSNSTSMVKTIVGLDQKIRRHMIRLTPGGTGRLECDHCDKTYWTLFALIQHLKSLGQGQRVTVTPDPGAGAGPSANAASRFYCPECGIGFLYRRAVQSHMKNTHKISKVIEPIQLTISNSTSTGPPSGESERSKVVDEDDDIIEIDVNENEKITKPKAPRNFQCPKCVKKYTRKSDVDRHLRQFHKQKKEKVKVNIASVARTVVKVKEANDPKTMMTMAKANQKSPKEIPKKVQTIPTSTTSNVPKGRPKSSSNKVKANKVTAAKVKEVTNTNVKLMVQPHSHVCVKCTRSFSSWSELESHWSTSHKRRGMFEMEVEEVGQGQGQEDDIEIIYESGQGQMDSTRSPMVKRPRKMNPELTFDTYEELNQSQSFQGTTTAHHVHLLNKDFKRRSRSFGQHQPQVITYEVISNDYNQDDQWQEEEEILGLDNDPSEMEVENPGHFENPNNYLSFETEDENGEMAGAADEIDIKEWVYCPI